MKADCACRVIPTAFSIILLGCCLFWPARVAGETLLLDITGVSGELRANVESVLALPEGMVKENVVNRLWLRNYIKKVPSRVRQALEPLGYYESQTTATLDEKAEGRFVVTVRINPGSEILLAGFRLELIGEGRDEPLLRQQLKEFPLHEGSVLRHDLYEQGKAQLESATIDLGYLKAAFVTHIVRVDVGKQQAQLELVLNTGPKFYFGPVDFPSSPDYPKRFLQRYLAFQAGEVFSYSLLGQTQSQLIDSDHFKSVVIDPRVEEEEAFRVPVDIYLVEKPRRTLRPGIGYGTDTGPRFSLLYQDINVWHQGHQFKLDTVIAEMRQSADATYLFPHYRNFSSYTAIKTGLDREKTDTYLSRKIFAEIELVNSRDRRNVLSFYARLQREDYEVGGVDQVSQLLIPGVRWSYRTYDSPTRPERGYHVVLDVRGTREGVLSDTSLLQVIGEANTLISMPARFSLFLRGRGATTVQANEFDDVPASMRFFAGGDQSVRGYAYQSLGPLDVDGNVVGGKHLLVGSVELERAIATNWGIATFYDVGNAFNNLNDYELARAAGIGLRWYTLIGPVRLDLARQLNRPDPSYRVHFSMGFAW